MDLTKLIEPGTMVEVSVPLGVKNLTNKDFLVGEVIETTIVEWERKYLVRFGDGSSAWVSNFWVRHVGTVN